ncbi:MAG: hypothetical protein ACYCS8_18695 [Acidithiobacillus sp.]
MRDFADKSWLREHSRCVPEKSLTHPDHSPAARPEVDALYQARAELAWRLARLGR